LLHPEGLHPETLLIPFLILLPNLLFAKLQPCHLPDPPVAHSRFFGAAEWVGRFGVIASPLFYSVHVRALYEISALLVMLLSLFLYYLGWGRYCSKVLKYELLYRSYRRNSGSACGRAGFIFSVVLGSFAFFRDAPVRPSSNLPNSFKEYKKARKE